MSGEDKRTVADQLLDDKRIIGSDIWFDTYHCGYAGALTVNFSAKIIELPAVAGEPDEQFLTRAREAIEAEAVLAGARAQ